TNPVEELDDDEEDAAPEPALPLPELEVPPPEPADAADELDPALPPTTAFTAVTVPATGAVRVQDARFLVAVSTATWAPVTLAEVTVTAEFWADESWFWALAN